MEAESFERAAEEAGRFTHVIDQYHREFMREVRLDSERLEVLTAAELRFCRENYFGVPADPFTARAAR